MIFTRGWIFLIPRVLGLIATLNQWWEQADRHFQVALDVATRVNAQPELGRTYLDYALMLEDRGHADDLGHVQRFASQARTTFAPLRMVPFLQRADELQQRLQPSAPMCHRSCTRYMPPFVVNAWYRFSTAFPKPVPDF